MSEEAPNATTEERRGIPWGWIVGSILGILALLSVSIPIFTGAALPAKSNAASSTARGIYMGLLNYADDHNGEFPTATTNSNDAYRKLIPDYIENEKPFYVAGCAWHAPLGGRPVEDIGSPPDYAKALERGENHWAYVSGLRKDSPPYLPIIADGFSETIGVYSNDPTKKGGVWEGKKAIVVYLDGSIRTYPPDPKSLRVIRTTPGGKKVDIFSKDWGTDPSKVLNPQP